MMKLYHGSNVEVIKPKILESVRNLDFGNGFYLTTDFEQAKKWSKSTTKRRKTGIPTVSVFNIDELEFENLKVKKFKNPNEEWLQFVSKNRKRIIYDNVYDIIIGPVADDDTMPTIDLYIQGYINEKEAIARLLPYKLKDQVVFKTEKSLSKFNYIETISILD